MSTEGGIEGKPADADSDATEWLLVTVDAGSVAKLVAQRAAIEEEESPLAPCGFSICASHANHGGCIVGPLSQCFRSQLECVSVAKQKEELC